MKDAKTGPVVGWEEMPIERLFAPLEDGRALHQGWSPQCEKEPSPSEDVWGVLKTTSIQAGEFQPQHNKLLPTKLAPRPVIEVKEGDILITCAGPRVRCGVSCLVRQSRKRLMMSGKMYRFRVDTNRADPRYVEAFLQTEEARQAIDKMKTGSSESGLNLTHDRFRQLPIPVAPLDEQRRIVGEIEKQFTRLETGIAALQSIRAKLKRYRARILKAACEGGLVPTEAELARKENRSYETGGQLLQRILAERRKNWSGKGKYKEPAPPDATNLPAIPKGWTWASVEQLAAPEPNSITDGPFGSNLKTEHYTDSGPRVIRLQNVGDGVFVKEEAHISEKHFESLQKHRVFPNDLVIAALGENPPRSCLIPELLGPAIVKADCIRFKPHQDIPAKYLNIALNSDPVRRGVKNIVHGVGRPRLNLGEIKAIVLPLPPLTEQTRIVAEVERRFSVVEELEAVSDANLQRATGLRQSILQRAFDGELV